MPKIKASGAVGVQVEGLAELNRALRALGGRELQAELKEVGKEVAGEVASDARAKAYSLGGVAAHAAPSLTAAAGFTSAGVSLGGGSHPEALGAEFGGRRRPTTQQFQPWTGSGSDAGFFLYPAIRDNVDNIAEKYESGLEAVARRHGLL